METYKKYRSALGYVPAEDSPIDSYGVDHSGFTTQDEVAYQNARVNRENELINRYNQQGINENYPQQGAGFWGDATNNYGFGHTNIGANIENVTNRLDADILTNNQKKYDDFIKSEAFKQLRDFHIEKEGYNRTVDKNGLVFPYPGINGDITGCIGHNMKNDFKSHPWVDKITQEPMTISNISSEEDKIRSLPTALKTELYAAETDARLPKEYCTELYNQDIKTRWQTLDNAIPNWSKMTPEMQAATMEVHFTGNMAPKNSWRFAKVEAENMNKVNYCNQLHRDDTNRRDITSRNKWVHDICLKGKFIK